MYRHFFIQNQHNEYLLDSYWAFYTGNDSDGPFALLAVFSNIEGAKIYESGEDVIVQPNVLPFEAYGIVFDHVRFVFNSPPTGMLNKVHFHKATGDSTSCHESFQIVKNSLIARFNRPGSEAHTSESFGRVVGVFDITANDGTNIHLSNLDLTSCFLNLTYSNKTGTYIKF